MAAETKQYTWRENKANRSEMDVNHFGDDLGAKLSGVKRGKEASVSEKGWDCRQAFGFPGNSLVRTMEETRLRFWRMDQHCVRMRISVKVARAHYKAGCGCDVSNPSTGVGEIEQEEREGLAASRSSCNKKLQIQ